MKIHRVTFALTLLLLSSMFMSAQASPDATGTGTTNYLTRWVTSTSQGNSKIYQNSSGWLGINTTTPKLTFDINNGNLIARGIGNFTSGGNAAYLYAGDTSHGLTAYRGGGLVAHGGTALSAYQAANGLFLQDSTGYVGVNTTNPHNQLHVNGNVQMFQFVMYDYGSGTCAVYYSQGGNIYFNYYTSC